MPQKWMLTTVSFWITADHQSGHSAEEVMAGAVLKRKRNDFRRPTRSCRSQGPLPHLNQC